MKKLVGDIDDMLQWTNDLRTELKSGTPFGALPDTAKEQFEKFQVRITSMLVLFSFFFNNKNQVDWSGLFFNKKMK